ncbi:MAG TPA: endo-1,4-beta-xylanase [Oligoflexus sp.]|uniref:endo-1,4-beta-xylanase n=1 Tax=Oligoflexus sp. TaxID=1971216 RepID=UPI002D718378|nr:endo-1,4-beta-xylanase [Oligoflexus sp.]HYX36568.1 endo-1,4-beta-xylanase [Oligoflexus sp.]
MRKIGFFILLSAMSASIPGCGRKSSKSDLSTESRAESRVSGVIAEEWTGVPGDKLSALLADKRFPLNPTSRSFLTSLASPRKNLENYGTRIRGYIQAPETGAYTFFLSGDNESQFFLSTDDNPASLSPQPIAFLSDSEWSGRGEWEKFPGQVSRTITLQAGQRYYFQVLHKNGGAEGGVGVGWRLPSGEMERPIPQGRLSTYENDSPAGENAQNDSYHNQIKSMLLTNYGIVGGTWVFSTDVDLNTRNISISREKSTGAVVDAVGKPFSKAVELAITDIPVRPVGASLQLSTSKPISAGDSLLLIFWARTVSAPNQIGLGNFQFMLGSSPYTKFRSFEQRVVGSEWKQYILPVEVTQDIPAGDAKFVVELGVAKQTLQIGGVTALNYGKSYTMSSLPVQSNDDYVGREANAPWRLAAQERIERIRKANLQVSVLNASGQPVPNAQVRIEMLRHEFAFGTAIQENRIAGNKNQDDKYQEKLLNLDGKGHGFNAVVFENGHKWKFWEQNNWPLNNADNVRTVRWLVDRGITVRGHTLFWPGWGNSPDNLRGKSLQEIKDRINGHLTTMLKNPTYPDLSLIKEWDVLNEPTGNVDIANTFAGSPGYPTGREIYQDVFKKVKELAPDVKAYVNEAQLTNFYVKSDVYKSYVEEVGKGLRDSGSAAKVDGVGLQAHFRYLIPPAEMLQHFEDYHVASLGGKIKITEYDNATLAPDDIQRDYFRDILTATFSYEHADGFLMWGFWDGTSKKAALFDSDWNLKPFATPFIDLVFKDWWTPTTELRTDANGKVSLRGFKGTYKITVTDGGQQKTQVIKLGSDQNFTANL